MALGEAVLGRAEQAVLVHCAVCPRRAPPSPPRSVFHHTAPLQRLFGQTRIEGQPPAC